MKPFLKTVIGNFMKLVKICWKKFIYYPGMDLLGGAHPPLALARGGVLFFMIKQKIIRDKIRFSNLSDNMMISEL
jgi:hypothetical protein